MIELIISSEELAETIEMADDLMPQFGRVAGVRARRIQRPVPGVASEPITTAILVALVAQVTSKGVGEIWSILRKRVLRSGRTAEVAVNKPDVQGADRITIVVTPMLADSERVPAALSEALGVAQQE